MNCDSVILAMGWAMFGFMCIGIVGFATAIVCMVTELRKQ